MLKIVNMKSLTAAALAIAALGVAGQGCGGIAGAGIETAVTIPVQTIPGNPVGGLIHLDNFNVPLNPSGSNTIPQNVTSILLTDLELRTVTSDASDETDQALKDPSLIGQCRSGQPDLGFIDSLTISIKKQGAADSTAVWLAKYTKDQNARSAPCGIRFEVNPEVELLDYIGGYALSTQVSGSAPSQDVKIGGFARVEVEGEYPAPGQSGSPSATGSGGNNPSPGSSPSPSPGPTGPIGLPH